MTFNKCHSPSEIFTCQSILLFCLVCHKLNLSFISALKYFYLHVLPWSCPALSLRLVQHSSEHAAPPQQPRSAEQSRYVTEQGTRGETPQAMCLDLK